MVSNGMIISTFYLIKADMNKIKADMNKISKKADMNKIKQGTQKPLMVTIKSAHLDRILCVTVDVECPQNGSENAFLEDEWLIGVLASPGD